jgi:isocitrate dehydrogenase (NAD+)
MMLSAAMMLRYLHENEAANKLERAIADVIAEGKNVTYDLKAERNQPAAGTSQVADAVIRKLREASHVTKNDFTVGRCKRCPGVASATLTISPSGIRRG